MKQEAGTVLGLASLISLEAPASIDVLGNRQCTNATSV